MAVSTGAGQAGDRASAQARPGRGSTRREVVCGLRLCVFAAVVAAPVAAALRSQHTGSGHAPSGTVFTETRRGHHIGVVWTQPRGPAGQGRWHVTVDGIPLHLMRRADGTWLSMVDHYCSHPSPIEAARAAVDALGPGRRLREPAPARAGHVHTENRRGVRT
ncbi:tyrosinase family oxidase copper chaperone [Streptomyces iakyrus]|uniref:tyrosinase family oxidase copper chaperone n=1 Tax=Streptomyces iakyrus TaxID=68219 RepID=UPI000527293F|nr:tyrosinase family oxidase copper chaperone [Streptomyces iakyrus]